MSLLQLTRHLFHPQRSNNHRPRVLHPEFLVGLAFLVIVGFGLVKEALYLSGNQRILGFASSITPSQVVELTNNERAKLGLPSLTSSQALNQAALAKAQNMFSNQYWAHIAPDGKEPWSFIQEAGYQYTVAGENLARDFDTTPTMMSAWMESPTHRANILNQKYQEIGIAVVDGVLQGVETTLVVQMFGSPQSSGRLVGEVPASEGERVTVLASDIQQASTTQVLGGFSMPFGQMDVPPLFSPLQLSKAIFLSLILLISATLIYDSFVIGHHDTMRLVGKNMAHIFFLGAVAFLLIFFKAGLVG